VLWTVLAAAHIDGAADGDVIVGGIEAAHVEHGSAGASVVVEHASDIDALVVLHDDAVIVHRTADLAPPVALDPFDPLTPVGRFVDVPDGERVAGADVAAAMRLLGTVSSAAMLVGLASRALDVARDYALERQQFGVPIGSFQAIKHMLADMYVRGALAQSATYAAAAVVHEPGSDDTHRAASAAKLLAAEAAITNAGDAVQVLGGMGFTWAMPTNHLLKRAWVLEHTFGTTTSHARSLGSSLVPTP
jgi:alkylation response protein AidB-like acyl-CoA dehydrogenase